MLLEPGAGVGAVFTKNRFCAAPVQVCREHLAGPQEIRALLINTGNANAGTGAQGLERARASSAALAASLGLAAQQVLPFSTGVIMEPLPVDRIVAGLPAAVADATQDNWFNAAQAIMTTDTVPKASSVQATVGGATVTVTGISKGAGMIRPNMATMLGFMATDARVAPGLMSQLAQQLADATFNRVTVDGDTSTNDSFVVIATNKAKHACIESLDSADGRALKAAMLQVARTLAHAIVRDGEGATKFITITVQGGRDTSECLAVGICHRAFAAGQDRVFRQRPQSGPHSGRRGLRRHRRSGPDRDRAVSGRCACGHPGRAQPGLPGGRRPARDEAERNHGAGRPGPRQARPTRSGPATSATTT